MSKQQSVQELEGEDWREPKYDSHLVSTIYRLRRKPLDQFTHEDLRIMIGQGVGLEFLMPLAIEVLQRDALASGDFYPGDLLAAVSRVEEGFWHRHTDWYEAVRAILRQVLDQSPSETVLDILREASAFKNLD
jgi:hypothetical protein